MAWIVGIVILILLVVSAGFRKFAGVLVLICVVSGLLYWLYQENEEAESKKRIRASDLKFEGVFLKPSYSSYDLVGRITNNSAKYTLKVIQLKLTFKDCDKVNTSNCIVVAQNDEHIYISIPPGQARDFKEGVYLNSNLNIKGTMVWEYAIEYTKAE
jgi:hypothetical protein